MFDLSHKVVLITGAGHEVGHRIACVLAKFGATIIACDENRKKAERTCGHIFTYGGIGIPVSFDVTDAQTAAAALNNITEKLGDIDILIYTAGTVELPELSATTSISLSDEEWARILDIHLTGFINCCQVVIGPMARKNWGRVIKINSGVARLRKNSCCEDEESTAISFVSKLVTEAHSNGITFNTITLLKHQNKTADRSCESDLFHSPYLRSLQDAGYLSLYLSTESAAWISGHTIPLEITY